jgi:hypothetical protein
MAETEGMWKGDLFVRTSKRLNPGERIECLCDPSARKKNASALLELYGGVGKGFIAIDFPIQGLKARYQEGDDVKFQQHGSWYEEVGTVVKVQTYDSSCDIKHGGNETEKGVAPHAMCHAFCNAGKLKGRIDLVLANFSPSRIQDTTSNRYRKDWSGAWTESTPVWSMGIVESCNPDMSYRIKLNKGGPSISALRDILRVSKPTTHSKSRNSVSANAGYKVGERVKWKNVLLEGGKRRWANSGEAMWTDGTIASAKFGSYSVRYGPTVEVQSLEGRLRGLESEKRKVARDDDESFPADLASAQEQVTTLTAAKEALGDTQGIKGTKKLAAVLAWVRVEKQVQSTQQQLEQLKQSVGADCGVPIDCVRRVAVDPHKKAMTYWARNEEKRRKEVAKAEKRRADAEESVKGKGWRVQTMASNHQMKSKNATLLEKG